MRGLHVRHVVKTARELNAWPTARFGVTVDAPNNDRYHLFLNRPTASRCPENHDFKQVAALLRMPELPESGENGKVLVCCNVARSRSPASDSLMKKPSMTLEGKEALWMVIWARP